MRNVSGRADEANILGQSKALILSVLPAGDLHRWGKTMGSGLNS